MWHRSDWFWQSCRLGFGSLIDLLWNLTYLIVVVFSRLVFSSLDPLGLSEYVYFRPPEWSILVAEIWAWRKVCAQNRLTGASVDIQNLMLPTLVLQRQLNWPAIYYYYQLYGYMWLGKQKLWMISINSLSDSLSEFIIHLDNQLWPTYTLAQPKGQLSKNRIIYN